MRVLFYCEGSGVHFNLRFCQTIIRYQTHFKKILSNITFRFRKRNVLMHFTNVWRDEKEMFPVTTCWQMDIFLVPFNCVNYWFKWIRVTGQFWTPAERKGLEVKKGHVAWSQGMKRLRKNKRCRTDPTSHLPFSSSSKAPGVPGRPSQPWVLFVQLHPLPPSSSW